MRPNFALYGAAAVALVTLATVAEATPAYESDYGHVDEYKSNNYKHEAKYPSSYESDDYKHETSGGSGHFEPHKPSYGSHYEENYGHEEDSGYEEDYGHEEYRPSHYQPKYSMAPSYKHKPYESYSADEDYARSPSYKHQPSYDSYSADEDYGYEEYTEEASYKHQPSYKRQPSYRHKRSVGYGSPYGSQSYKHTPSYSPKQSVGYGSPYAERPSYRHRRSVDAAGEAREGQQGGRKLNSLVEDEGGVRESQSLSTNGGEREGQARSCCRDVIIQYDGKSGGPNANKGAHKYLPFLYASRVTFEKGPGTIGRRDHWVSDNKKYGIWWDGDSWNVGVVEEIGSNFAKAYNTKNRDCPYDFDWGWKHDKNVKNAKNWFDAGKTFEVNCD